METQVFIEFREIPLTSMSKSWYYKIIEHDVVIEGNVKKGKCTMTGILLEEAEIGDKFFIPGIGHHTIESIELRDSEGEFNNPDDAKNAFFTAECSFERVIN